MLEVRNLREGEDEEWKERLKKREEGSKYILDRFEELAEEENLDIERTNSGSVVDLKKGDRKVAASDTGIGSVGHDFQLMSYEEEYDNPIQVIGEELEDRTGLETIIYLR